MEPIQCVKIVSLSDQSSIQRNRTVGKSHGVLLLQDCSIALGYSLRLSPSDFEAMSSIFHCDS
jgi:hypothetical protein